MSTRSDLQWTACSNRLKHIVIIRERRTSCCIAAGARSWRVIVAILVSIIAWEARIRGQWTLLEPRIGIRGDRVDIRE